MKQPDSLDIGTKMDVVRHRLNVAKEDLESAYLTFEAGQFRAANNRALLQHLSYNLCNSC